jgi:hypothetical protein
MIDAESFRTVALAGTRIALESGKALVQTHKLSF